MEPIEMNPLGMPPNSKNSKTVKPQVKKRQLATIKKPLRARILDALCPEEPGSIGSFLVREILIPSAKDTLYSLAMNALEMSLWNGEPKANRRPRPGQASTPNGGSHVSYGSYFNSPKQQPTYINTERMNYKDFIFETSQDAHEALNELAERLNDYDGFVKVADYYDIVQLSPPKQASYWGWNDLSEARVCREYGCWKIHLPRPIDIRLLNN